MLSESENKGEILKSKIKYGIVLHPPELAPRPNILKQNEKLPYGNLNFQLADSNTIIYGLPKK